MMKPTLKHRALGVTALVVAVALAGAMPNFAAFAQTTAPSTSTLLPEGTIKALQEALSKQGIAAPADGVLGAKTRAAICRYQSQHHLPVTGEPDTATLTKLGIVGQRNDLPGGPRTTGEASPGQGMSGMGPGMMGMMTPEMMRRMMAQGGMTGQGMSQGGMGPGMMKQGQMPMAGGMTMSPMMQMMNMQGMMDSPAMLYGMPHGAQEEMTPERVRTFLEQRLTRHGNPRLKLGEIATAADESITAEIVTVDGSVVQKLAFNRYPGLFRQVP